LIDLLPDALEAVFALALIATGPFWLRAPQPRRRAPSRHEPAPVVRPLREAPERRAGLATLRWVSRSSVFGGASLELVAARR
jgi:hypothetical protein